MCVCVCEREREEREKEPGTKSYRETEYSVTQALYSINERPIHLTDERYPSLNHLEAVMLDKTI